MPDTAVRLPIPGQRPLDVVTIGRASADFYGEQVGGRLEDTTSFAKYVGGCPTNIAVGCARLGLKAALVTRVGDDHMGRFIREQLGREGVDTRHVTTDKQRLTALVVLGIRDQSTFPLIFFRRDCADMALDEGDIDEATIRDARAVVVTGTHFSTPTVAAASRKAMRLARRHAAMVVLDIDYRPVLWGLTAPDRGEDRFVAATEVTATLQPLAADCDLIVGTEEELAILAGTTDPLAALRRLRELTQAAIVLKRGEQGCLVFPDAIPDRLEAGVTGRRLQVAVFNVLGAGDAFMAGLLHGLLGGQDWPTACWHGNACGALVVTRHGCAPAMPTAEELAHVLGPLADRPYPERDPQLAHLHRVTTRRGDWPEICALAFDHRLQLEQLADRLGTDRARIPAFKKLIFEAAWAVNGGQPSFGLLLDDRYGADLLARVSGTGAWIARPIEEPGVVPLAWEHGPDPALTIRAWPVEHHVKVLVQYHPEDPAALQAVQEQQLLQAQAAAHGTGHELVIEAIPTLRGRRDDGALVDVVERFYAIGLKPDWWKVASPGDDRAWSRLAALIETNDRHCRGIVMLGGNEDESLLVEQLEIAARQPRCRGFAIGRTIFGAAAEAWFKATLSDEAAVADMSERYRRLIGQWRRLRPSA